MPQLHELTALDLAAAYRSGDTSPTEVVEHLLGRVDRISDTVGAFVTVTAERAREQAAEATTRFARGEDLPLLFGVPTAIKDLHLTKDVRTQFGSPTMAGFVPDSNDEVVNRIEAAGMISLGKTNTPEFGSPCYTEPDIAPPARTPYDLTRSAGGSSGGAAAAVAAGLLPVAHGSDGGGSIRIPASVTGLVGVKPSRGRISGSPLWADITGLSTSGPLANTVRDAAAFLDVMAGRHPGDAMWAAETEGSYLDWCERPPASLRVARFATPVISEAEVHPEVVRTYDRASELLARLGHEVVDVAAPVSPTVVPAFEVVWSVSAAMWPVPPDKEKLLRPLTRWLIERGRASSAPEFGQALRTLRQVTGQVLSALNDFDVVLTPTVAQLPAPVGGLRNDDDPAADFEAQKAFTPFTSLWNVTGMPACSLPTGWSTDGLPIGIMLAGRPASEHVLFALAAQLEAEHSTTGIPWDRPGIPAL